MEAMCMFDKFHLILNFGSKVPRDNFERENECQLAFAFSFKMSSQCHMPSSTWHLKFKSKVSIDVWSFSSQVTLHVKTVHVN